MEHWIRNPATLQYSKTPLLHDSVTYKTVPRGTDNPSVGSFL